MIKKDNIGNCRNFYKKNQKRIEEEESNLSFEEIYNILINIDPSEEKKYCVWIFNQYIRKQFTLNDVDTVKKVISGFLEKNPKLTLQKFDYNEIKNLIPKTKDKCQTYYDINKKKINIDNFSYKDVFNILMSISVDKKYCTWVIDQYIKEEFELNDVKKVKDNLNFYLNISDRKNIRQLDNNYTYSDMVRDINIWKNIKLSNIKKDGATILYDGVFGRLVSPLTKKASCDYGKGTKWCTAATISQNMFSEYNSRGSLYIWTEGGTRKKYQFHFEDGQFMDEIDKDIDDKKLRYFIEEDPVISILFLNNMDVIINNPYSAYKYAKATGERLYEAEENIIKDEEYIIEYATDVINGRWEEAERYMLDSNRLYLAIEYTRVIINDRWMELEKKITSKIKNMDDLINIYKYYIKINKPMPEIEELLLKYKNNIIDEDLLPIQYAERTGKRWIELENKFLNDKNFSNAIIYTIDVIKGRWYELEDLLLDENLKMAFLYDVDVLKRRWPELEDKLLNEDLELAYKYARDVIKGRWSELEDKLLNDDLELAYKYERDVIKGRWPELEYIVNEYEN